MTNIVQVKGNQSTTVNANRLHSNNVWADCPITEILTGSVEGKYFFDDFSVLPAQTIAANAGNYYAFGDAGSTFVQVANSDYGQIAVTTDNTDEDGAGIMHGNQAGWARFGTTDRVWFEARYTPGQVGDTLTSSFLGFVEAENAPTGDVSLADASGLLATGEDHIGWRTLLGNGDYIEPVYQEGGATIKAVSADGSIATVGSGYGGAVVAGTFKKFAVKFNGPTGLLEYFEDGLRVAYTTITSANSFPDANHLGMILVGKSHTAAISTWKLDWWAGAYVSLA